MPMIHFQNGNLAVVSSSSKMPSAVKARYRHVAIVEVKDPNAPIHQIREQGNVLRVMEDSGPLFEGLTARCAFARECARMIQ